MNTPSSPTRSATITVLDHLIDHLRDRDAAHDGQQKPKAILWTDPKAEWRSLIEQVQSRAPEVLVLGKYDSQLRSGPAIWIRCLVDGALEDPKIPDDHAPIVYLPGIGRQQLRAGEDCPHGLKPIVELMFRGTLWLQHNGSDWSVTSFLTSTKTLSLDIARDRVTSDALLRALPEVALTPISQLAGRHLQADDFDRMLAGDVVRDLLRWMGDPAGTKARLGASGWGAFCSRCRDELGFDPETEADVTAGERLGRGEGPWAAVWERFNEAPTSYGRIADLLRRSRPAGNLPFDRERWPDLNDQDEEMVRKALAEIRSLSQQDACDALARLDREHGPRRNWVWARTGLAPMAQTLEPLARLAAGVQTALGGTNPDDVAAAYLERGWQADTAAWEAVATASTADEALVCDVVRQLVQPWLEDSARSFQAALGRHPIPSSKGDPEVEAGEDVCILFADGLRYDLGRSLAERLENRGCRVTIGHRWAALPTVTATAKPAVTPVADAIVGDALGEDFAPRFKKGKTANAHELRAAMKKRGYQILGNDQMDWPQSQPARGWVEAGDIDTLGHTLGARLAHQMDEQLVRLADRIVSLLDAGWKAVRIVTDHGWLLLPGGLPKVDLPKHLTATRWSRCAVIAGSATPSVMRTSWHWNATQSFASPPGIACFNKSEEYTHGGLSVQECLTPDLLVERSGEPLVTATIASITWRGLRCFVEVSVRAGEIYADLRLGRPSGKSIAASRKSVETDGSVSLVLQGDEHEEADLVLVLLNETGNILAHKQTQVGVDS